MRRLKKTGIVSRTLLVFCLVTGMTLSVVGCSSSRVKTEDEMIKVLGSSYSDSYVMAGDKDIDAYAVLSSVDNIEVSVYTCATDDAADTYMSLAKDEMEKYSKKWGTDAIIKDNYLCGEYFKNKCKIVTRKGNVIVEVDSYENDMKKEKSILKKIGY